MSALDRKQKVGDKIWLSGEKQGYTIRACNDRYIICTKPFNLRKTYFYTIIDLDENIRGTEDLVFCLGFETDEECNEALQILITGQSEVSHRNRVPLNIIKIIQ